MNSNDQILNQTDSDCCWHTLVKKQTNSIGADSLFDYADFALNVGDMISRSCFVVGDA